MQFFESSEFAHEYKRLLKRYRSLDADLRTFKLYLAETPSGNDSKHWNCLHKRDDVAIYKVRLTCAYLRASVLRIVYAYHVKTAQIVFIEIYYKGDKEAEDKERISVYLKRVALE